nr:uncharacterized protein LOC107448912 [Parasteatoda tepidariorum]
MHFSVAFSLIYTLLLSKIRSSLSATVSAVHVCAYSADTTQYTPNCYDCIQDVYNNALMACLNASAMPKNITFKAANCMEGNCKIPYFTPTTPEVEDVPPMWDFFSKLFLAGGSGSSAFARAKRSVKDNSVDSMSPFSSPMKFNIVKRVETVVGKPEMRETELDYEEM